MSFTNIKSLETALREAVSDNKLVLNQHLLPEGVATNWMITLPEASISVNVPVFGNPDDKSLTLSGSFGDSWAVPFIAGGKITLGTITCAFTQASEGEKIATAITFTNLQLTIGTSTYTLAGTVDAHSKLKLDWSGSGDSATLATLAGDFSAGYSSSSISTGLDIFNAVSLKSLSATFSFGENSASSFALGIGIDQTWDIVDGGGLSINNPVVNITTVLESDGEGGTSCEASYELHGDITIASTEYHTSLSFSRYSDWSLTVSSKNDNSLPSLADLAEHAGGTELKDKVNQILSSIPVSNLKVLGLNVLFNPFEKKLKALSVQGSLQFFDGVILFTSSLPDFSLSAHLAQNSVGSAADGSSIHLKPLFAEYFGSSMTLPDTRITELSFFAGVSAGNYSFALGVNDLIEIPIGQNHLSLDKVEISTHKSGESISGELSSTFTLGGVTFSASADYSSDNGWTFQGDTVKGGISLVGFTNSLLSFFGTQLPSSLPDIHISELSVSFNTVSKEFSFSAETDTEIEIPFLTGDKAKIHADIDLKSTVDTATGIRQLSGFMEGDFTIGTSQFTLQYSLGKESHVFEASWESTSTEDLLGINTILDAMGVSHDVSIPSELDLNLKKIYLQYQAETETLKLVADSATYGEVFLIVSKLPLGQPHPDENIPAPGTAEWQFVFGWNYVNVTKLSDVPGLGKHFGPADILHFESLGVMISSADIKNFEIPDMPALKEITAGVDISLQGTTGNTRKPVAHGATVPLGKGLAFVAILDLASSDQGGNMPGLRKVVTEPTLTVMAAVDLANEIFSVKAILGGGVTIPTGGSSDLRISNAALAIIFNDGVAFQVSGELAMHFDHETIDVDPKLTIMAEGIEFQIDVVFEDGWKKPMGISGLILDEVGFEMGVDFIPPGINIGLEGQSHIGTAPRSSDNFAFVLEVIEEVPDPLLLSFYLKEIDIPKAMEIFVPERELPALPQFVKEIKLSEVSFYWAEEPVPLPDGNIAQPGLRFGGAIEVLSFEAYAALAIDQSSGIAGTFEMTPVHFHNVLSITGNGQGIYLDKKDGKIVPIKIKPDKDRTGVEKVEIVAPGGPVFAFRTTQSPYLQVSIEVSFLDLLHEQIEALVQDTGIYFKLEYSIGNIVKAEVDFTLNKTGFTAHSLFGIHLKFNVGPIKILGIDFGTIHIDTGFDIELYISASADHFELSVNGEFDFEGARLHFPELKLEFAPKSLADLPKMIIDHVIEEADEIFKDLFDAAGKLIKEGLKEAEHLAEEAGKEVAKIATEAEKEAEKIVSDAAKAVEHTAEEAAAEVVKIEKEAAELLTNAAHEVVELEQEAVAEVEKIGKEIAHVAEEAEQEIENIGKEIAREAEEVAHEVSKLASEAVEEVKAIADAVAKEVSAVLDEARKVAGAVIAAARQVVNALEEEAEKLFDEAKKLAKAIEDAAKKAAEAVAHAAKKVWHAISKY